jgi:hypothetical protein
MKIQKRRCVGISILIALSSLLSSCLGTSPEYLDIRSPEALNGSWLGATQNLEIQKTLRLELSTITIDKGHYSVTGTLQLGTDEVLQLAGTVTAGLKGGFGQPTWFEGKATNNGTVVWDVRMLNSAQDNWALWNFDLTSPGSQAGASAWGEVTR